MPYDHPDPWWRHVVLHTRGAWLPGDPKGFRSRGHKIHSSGDYKHRPPPDEHRGLYDYSKRLCPTAATIPVACRSVIGWAFVKEFEKRKIELLALAACPQHVHLQVKLPNDENEQWEILGRGKRAASHAVRAALPGSVWGRKGRIETIKDKAHHLHVFRTYIPDHRFEGGWVWTFKDGVMFDPAG